MTTRTARPLDLSPLSHPAWWGALGLLLLNDNLLKGRHVIPGWLTGKLSDFAFLIVAPVLLAALLPVGLRARRTLATLSVVGVFVAADLSASFSDAVVALAARLGLHWRLWPDPTDLLALSVLPLTVHIMRSESGTKAPLGRSMQRASEYAGVLVGAVACLATSAEPTYPHSPFFVNRLPTTAALRVTWVLRTIDCTATAESVAATLLPSDMDDPLDLAVDSGQVVALDGPGTSPIGQCSVSTNTSAACIAAIVESGAASPVLVVAPMQWYSADGASVCKSPFGTGGTPGPDALSLALVNGQQMFAAGAKLQTAALSPADIARRAPQTDGCRPTRAAYAALVSQDACTSAADCQALVPLSLANARACEFVYTSRAVSPAAVEALVTRWQSACFSRSDAYCTPQPAICQAGICTEPCPGVYVPKCPGSCGSFGSGAVAGASCDSYLDCVTSDGLECTCAPPQVVCSPIARVSPSCALPCVGWPFSSPAGSPDAGADVTRSIGDAVADGSDDSDSSNDATADAKTSQ